MAFYRQNLFFSNFLLAWLLLFSLQRSAKYSYLYSSEYLHLYKKNGVETMPNTGDKR